MLERYLAELRSELASRLPSEDLAARMAEIELHLREGIEGRVELGMPPEEAEREAVAAFGESRRIARAEPAPKPSPRLRVVLLLAGYALAGFFLMVAPQFRQLCPASLEALFAACVGLAVAFAISAFRARRPATLPVAGAGLGAALGLWLLVGATWLDLYVHGGTGYVAPGQLAQTIANNEALLADKRHDLAFLNAAGNALERPGGIESMRVKGGYRAPTMSGTYGWDSRLTMTVYPNVVDATSAWAYAREHEGLSTTVAALVANLAAIRSATAAGYGSNLMAVAPSLVSGCVGATGLAVITDLLFSGLGTLAGRRRHRKAGGKLRA